MQIYTHFKCECIQIYSINLCDIVLCAKKKSGKIFKEKQYRSIDQNDNNNNNDNNAYTYLTKSFQYVFQKTLFSFSLPFVFIYFSVFCAPLSFPTLICWVPLLFSHSVFLRNVFGTRLRFPFFSFS